VAANFTGRAADMPTAAGEVLLTTSGTTPPPGVLPPWEAVVTRLGPLTSTVLSGRIWAERRGCLPQPGASDSGWRPDGPASAASSRFYRAAGLLAGAVWSGAVAVEAGSDEAATNVLPPGPAWTAWCSALP
jgi:hypothetical protein